MKLSRLLILLGTALLCGFIPPPTQRHGQAPQKTVNLINDAGATCNGVADDGPALMNAGVIIRAFQVTNPKQPVTLLIPSGSHCVFTTFPPASDNGSTIPFNSISNLTVIATGAILDNNPGKWTNAEFLEAVLGHSFSFNFNTNAVNDVCVTMTTPGQETNYSVGEWVIVAGPAMQVNSYPPNYGIWEFAQIASIPSGQVCLTAPLKNVYSSTQIDTSLANCSNAYCGGPGRLVPLVSWWDGYIHIVGGTWNTTNQTIFSARLTIYDNMTVTGTGQACFFPTIVQNIIYNNNTVVNCNMEIDKEIGTMIINGGTFHNLTIQSASFNNMVVKGGAHIDFMDGMALNTTCNNSEIFTLRFGNSIGTQPQSFAGNNCQVVSDIINAFANSVSATSANYLGSGLFTFPHNDIYAGFSPWAVTGGVMVMSGISGDSADNLFTIGIPTIPGFIPGGTDQTIQVPTSLSGASLPPPGGTLTWHTYQMRNITCTGCFGSNGMLDLNQPGAQNKPIWAYVNRTYTCANNVVNVPGSLSLGSGSNYNFDAFGSGGLWGSVKVNVTQADTNPTDAGNQIKMSLGETWNITTGTEAFLSNTILVNLQTTGLRTVNATTTSGGVAGDTLTAPGTAGQSIWSEGGSGSSGSIGIGGTLTNGPAAQCPVVNLEISMTP